MNKVIFFASAFALLCCPILSSAQVGDTTLYKACCGVEPVEYKAQGANVYVPNVFTPNADGANDYFMPFFNGQVRGVDTYSVYTAEGDTLLFHSEGFHTDDLPNYAWNGNRADGTPYVGPFGYEFYMS